MTTSLHKPQYLGESTEHLRKTKEAPVILDKIFNLYANYTDSVVSGAGPHLNHMTSDVI